MFDFLILSWPQAEAYNNIHLSHSLTLSLSPVLRMYIEVKVEKVWKTRRRPCHVLSNLETRMLHGVLEFEWMKDKTLRMDRLAFYLTE